MKKLGIAFCFLLGAYALQSCGGGSNQQNNQDSLESADSSSLSTTPTGTDSESSEFAMKAAKGGIMEVELGKMAQQKASNSRVKNFGTMMVDDHSKANDELKQIASSKGIQIPSTLDDEAQKEMDELNKKSGAEFDKAYMKLMVDDHQKDVDEFKEASEKLQDTTLKGFAYRTLPVLQKHLDSAKAIKDALK